MIDPRQHKSERVTLWIRRDYCVEKTADNNLILGMLTVKLLKNLTINRKSEQGNPNIPLSHDPVKLATLSFK